MGGGRKNHGGSSSSSGIVYGVNKLRAAVDKMGPLGGAQSGHSVESPDSADNGQETGSSRRVRNLPSLETRISLKRLNWHKIRTKSRASDETVGVRIRVSHHEGVDPWHRSVRFNGFASAPVLRS